MLVKFVQKRVDIKINHILSGLDSDKSILDVGSGNGTLGKEIKKRNFSIVSVDVNDNSFYSDMRPILYDGLLLPFKDKSFDTALLITMLHHTKNPNAVISECIRVASKLIIMEEVYTSLLHKYWTFFVDSVFNLEFMHHPHTNKQDAEWRDIFSQLELELLSFRQYNEFPVLDRVVYILKTKD